MLEKNQMGSGRPVLKSIGNGELVETLYKNIPMCQGESNTYYSEQSLLPKSKQLPLITTEATLSKGHCATGSSGATAKAQMARLQTLTKMSQEPTTTRPARRTLVPTSKLVHVPTYLKFNTPTLFIIRAPAGRPELRDN